MTLSGKAVAKSPHWTIGPSAQAKWYPYVDFEGRLGNKRNIGGADIFQPLAQTDDTLLFADVRGRFDDQDSREGNVGLGLRHMLDGGWNVGVYGYYDRRRSPYGNYFDQATFGGELLGRDWDFRANGYLPFGTRAYNVDSLNTAELSGTSVVFHGGEERALPGFDAEVGWRVPIWSYNADKALRFYAGGYYFGDGTAQDVTGPRLRLDFTMLKVPHLWKGSRLTLGGEFQHDNVRGTQVFGVVRLSVPLSIARPAVKLTAQEQRMLAHVERDVDVVSEAGAYGSAQTVTETSSGQSLSVVSSASTSGANLPTAVTNAGANSLVILSGTFNTTAKTTLASGQTLMGAGTLTVRAPDGRTASLTTPTATISATATAGGSSGPAVLLANNSTVTGLNISIANSAGLGTFGIFANGVTGATISNNTITASETGGNTAEGVVIGVGASVTVSNNTITATSTTLNTALGINVTSGSATVSGNTLSASGGSNNYYVKLSNANIGTGSSGNTAGNGACSHSGVNTGSIAFTNALACGP